MRLRECNAGTQDSGIDLREEESGTETEVGDFVAMGLGNALDQTVKAETPKLIGHSSWRDLVWGLARAALQNDGGVVR